MSVGPPDEIDDDEVGPDDAAMPTKPSERGAWRGRSAEDDDRDDTGR